MQNQAPWPTLPPVCKQGATGSIPVTSTNLIPALSIIYAAISAALFRCNFGTFGTTATIGVSGRLNPHPTRREGSSSLQARGDAGSIPVNPPT